MLTRLSSKQRAHALTCRRLGRGVRMPPKMQRFAMSLLLLACGLNSAPAANQQPAIASKTQHFDADPGWEAYQNRIAPQKARLIEQDFGYRESNFAGKGKGEIGGRIQRG